MTTNPGAYDPQSFAPVTFHDRAPAFRDGVDTPRDYLERCLATIDQHEPTVRAWVEINPDAARAAADLSSARWAEGKPRSPIDGMPIGIKDLLETRDMPTRMGCRAYADNFPKRDNAAVWALREAGAVVLGKTVTTELGGAEPGPTKNPFDPRRTPGGSSSGSAAAIGARMVPATIGTQVGGSIIRPASFCGNWALKPSQGAIHRGERQATSMSTHGVHAGCAQDMWLVAIAIAERTGGDPGFPALAGPDRPPAAHRPMALAVMHTDGWENLDPATREAFHEVAEHVAAAGVLVLDRSTSPAVERFEAGLTGANGLTNTITAWENHWTLRNLVREYPDGVSERAKGGLRTAEALGPTGYMELLRRRGLARQEFASLATVVDAVIAPASPGPAPLWSGDEPGAPPATWPTGDPVFNTPSSLLGAPVVTVPILAVGGMPVGIQVMGFPGRDAQVTAIARWLADAVPPSIR